MPVLESARLCPDEPGDPAPASVLLTGAEAVVRLLLEQKAMDVASGLSTAGFVSGYPGSPLGGLDGQFVQAAAAFEAAAIRFRPGLNEELAATAVWGTQQAELRGEGRFDGVFSIWYGKGPGVDRCGDVFRHANLAGTSRHGGVLALMGDDHNAESSSTAHQSEFACYDIMMPMLQPAGVGEIIQYGLIGFAMSRYCGTWVAMKCVKDSIESTSTVFDAHLKPRIVIPDDLDLPAGGLNIRLGDDPIAQEIRLHDHKTRAMAAFVRANGLNRLVTTGGSAPCLGILTGGKSYLDTVEALALLGLDLAAADRLGVRIYKVGCTWPLTRRELRDFALNLPSVLVVEEKRALLEVQYRTELFGIADIPLSIGKEDEERRALFPTTGALDPLAIALAIGERLQAMRPNESVAAHLEGLRRMIADAGSVSDVARRIPHFCSGCPHNTSTRLPKGARGGAGIGCHYMVQWMDRGTEGFTQMGGEGANWIGEAPFSRRPHMFQNLGDGTFSHSGVQAIRAAVADGTNITFKILYNGAIAMTGGQPLGSDMTVHKVAHQVAALGVRALAIVAETPDAYAGDLKWPDGVRIHPRGDLDAVQSSLAALEGVTVLIYDQDCATDRRRLRKRGLIPEAPARVFINDRVCEGCGDCGTQSNCVSIQPLETPLGRKRTIDQSNCNVDLSCLSGFCPSFVTVKGARPRTAIGTAGLDPASLVMGLASPAIAPVSRTWNLVLAGIGGTGIVTVAAILAQAAHIEGRTVGVIDMAGLAQKGGAVVSHLRIAQTPADLAAIRVASGTADLVLGFDSMVAGSAPILKLMRAGHTAALVNTAEVMPGSFTRDRDMGIPHDAIHHLIRARAGYAEFLDAAALATRLLGDSIGANTLMIGMASQRGLLPVSPQAIESAIREKGRDVAATLAAFRIGRIFAAAPERLDLPPDGVAPAKPVSLSETIAYRTEFLSAYQSAAWSARYRQRIARLGAAEASATGATELTASAVDGLFRLMSVKDEYEVARLYTDGRFLSALGQQFEGNAWHIDLHLAPPFLSRIDPATGRPKKMRFGPWMFPVLRWLAHLRRLRGTPLDPFGYSAERRKDRADLAAYEALVDGIAANIQSVDRDVARQLLDLPATVRGFGPVRAQARQTAELRRRALQPRLMRATNDAAAQRSAAAFSAMIVEKEQTA